jgi:drug/metabolite transporter (DMT)-like permease
MKIFNQYSAIWMVGLLVVVFGFVLLRRRSKWPRWLAFAIVVLGLVGAWVLLRPQQTTGGLTAAQVQVEIGAGTPVLLELQSPY